MKITNGNDIYEKYEIELVTTIIVKYNFKNIAIQLPDCMLNDALFISRSIRRKHEKYNEDERRELVSMNGNGETRQMENDGGSINSNGIRENGVSQGGISGTGEANPPSGDPINLYILGDTTLNECCEDYVSADHVHADFLVHYGISCQSFITPYTPSVYIFNKKNIEDTFFENINNYLMRNKIFDENKISIILCDVSYINYMHELVICFIDKSKFDDSIFSSSFELNNSKVVFDVEGTFFFANNSFYKKSMHQGRSKYKMGNGNATNDDRLIVNVAGQDKDKTDDDLLFCNVIICMHRIANNINGKVYYGLFNNYVAFDMDEKITDKYAFLCGRLLFKVFYHVKRKWFVYKIVHSSDITPHVEEGYYNENTNLFLFSSENLNFINRATAECSYNMDIYMYSVEDTFKKENNYINKILLRRYNLIEQSKQINVFGIIIGNVNLNYIKELKQIINYILRKNGKKCFTIVTNKLNSAKLENFSDIQMYILLTCPDHNFLELKNFSKKIINPYEFFIAYEYIQWQCKYVFDFHELLNISSIKKEFQNIHKNKYYLWNFGEDDTSMSIQNSMNEDNRMKEGNFALEKYDHLIDYSLPITIEDQMKFITTFNENSSMCKYFMESLKENEKREYKGVDMNYNIDTIPTLVQGLDGIAQRYDSDVKFCSKN
ncbi:diphthamide biosynthesis protein 2, putative (DPH2) [Plasmodium malariae]|uniref:Diphthamide biosynthesis protein 2, putative (DPH2) n=1 Tax=Plasmodium malariae TaxID=5858 RepID=A0A1A8WPE9_PLAMA|nr:diphthamide biosynthesis protein 2, putative (DPH2) [Plasmodium malariae]